MKTLIRVILTLPFVLMALEVGVRVVAPQPVEDIPYEDIFTERFSPSLKTQAKSLVPNIVRTHSGKEVRINSYGYRDYEYSREKARNIRRIAIIGSSETFGFRLALEETFVKILERTLNVGSEQHQYQVLLFGRPGFRAKDVYAAIMDDALQFRPDLVIYSFVQNSYEENPPESVLYNSETVHQLKNVPVRKNAPSALSTIRNYFSKIKQTTLIRFVRRNSHLYLFTANSVARVLREMSSAEKEKAQNIEPLQAENPVFIRKVKNTESWISLMAKGCENVGAKLAVLMLPYEMQLSAQKADKWRAKGINVPAEAIKPKTHQWMREFCDREDILFIDGLQICRIGIQSGSDIFMEGDYGHLNVEGNRLLANALVGFVRDFYANNY